MLVQLGFLLSFCSEKTSPISWSINSKQLTTEDRSLCQLLEQRLLITFRVWEYSWDNGQREPEEHLVYISGNVLVSGRVYVAVLERVTGGNYEKFHSMDGELIVYFWFVCIPSVSTKETTIGYRYLLNIFHNCLFLSVRLSYVNSEHSQPCNSALFFRHRQSQITTWSQTSALQKTELFSLLKNASS